MEIREELQSDVAAVQKLHRAAFAHQADQVDGLVQDTEACQAAFDLQRDVPTCTGARDGTCLSAAQKT